jgi:hypothetical protein
MWDSGEVRLGTVTPLWFVWALVGLLIFGLFSGPIFFWVLPGSASGRVTLDTNWLWSSAILRCCKVVVWILLSISLLRLRSEKVKVYIWLFTEIRLNMRGMLVILPHEHDGTVTCMFISWHTLIKKCYIWSFHSGKDSFYNLDYGTGRPLQPSRWRHHVPPMCWHPPTRLFNATTHKPKNWKWWMLELLWLNV